MSLCDVCNAACCRAVSLPLRSFNADQKRWMQTRGIVTGNIWRIRSVCEHLGADNRCMIYADRPDVCKEFEVGGECCRRARRAEGYME